MRYWEEIKKSDPRALAFAARHYSAQKGGREIGPPGQKIILLSRDGSALWGSHRPAPWAGVPRHDGLEGSACFIFRNEGSCVQSSELIKEAVGYTATLWDDRQFITYVAVEQVASVNPGYCFKVVGFERDRAYYRKHWKKYLGPMHRLILPSELVTQYREEFFSGS